MLAHPLIFIACAWSDPEDANLANELTIHLRPLESYGFHYWSESRIAAGQVRSDEIDRHMEQADIVLLLTSASFLADAQCKQIVVRAVQRQLKGQVRVIPIILRPCLWEIAPFRGLEPQPTHGKPVTSYLQRDEAWLDVIRAIIQADPRQLAPFAASDPKSASSNEHRPASGSTDAVQLSQRMRKKLRPAIAAEPIPLFSWIQLSDIHFGHGDASHGADQALVTSLLAEDIRRQLEHVPAPDVILVTGDIAFSGNTSLSRDGGAPREYAAAHDFLCAVGQSASVPAARIFLIPGNHDVQRTSTQQRDLWRLLRSLREGTESIDESLVDAKERRLLAGRFTNYRDFAEHFAPACLSAAPHSDGLVSWYHRYSGRHGLTVRLLGLNTALLSNDDADRGRLRLGMGALAQTLLPRPAPEELVLVLTHHPLRAGWLADQQEVDLWVRNHAHVHLSGHVHEADSEDVRSGAGGSFVRISAGATHGEHRAGHGYNFATIMSMLDGSLSLRVWPRFWSAKSKNFRTDANNLPDRQLYADHPLRLRIPPLS